jgi:FlaA1/EpsC-like NDP-sugar epimerase
MGNLKTFLWRKRSQLAFVVDAVCAALSYWLSFVVGLSGLGVPYAYLFLTTLPMVIASRLLFFWVFNLHKISWQYVSVTDLESIIKAVAASQAFIIALLVFITRLEGYPRRVFFIDALFLLFLLGGTRFGYRMIREKLRQGRGQERTVRTVIVGAGDAGERIARSLKYESEGTRVAVGFVDDDPGKTGQRIHGVPVLAKIAELPSVIKLVKVDEVIIATPSASPLLKKQIFAACEKTRVRVKTVPSLYDLMTGKKQIDELADVDLERLLGRESISTDLEKASEYLRGKRVLVTGAGGSIGGEICKQVLEFDPETLILVGRGENSLHDIRLRLAPTIASTKVQCVLASVTNKPKMSSVFDTYRPHVVFHAAAHKHVDLTEANCDEAVMNNVLGTRCILEASEEYGVERVVVISTDKAADPTSVMGCTKRIVEMLVSCREKASTVVVGVRFCNVLDSKGSVMPTFRRQIELGGPLNVTDERMKRYFMTIPEAVELVIQAGAIGQHGDILMLDMGEPVKIVDLAKQMIRLSGFVEGRDIHIKYTGIRPGEKLEEQLVGIDEVLAETEHPKIRRIQFGKEAPGCEKLDADIDYLVKHSIAMDLDKVRRKLMEMVPEYDPDSIRRTEENNRVEKPQQNPADSEDREPPPAQKPAEQPLS